MSNERHTLAVDFIKESERAWVGKTVIARRDSDALFHPGELCPTILCILTERVIYVGMVTEMADNSPQYLIQWNDGTTQLQV